MLSSKVLESLITKMETMMMMTNGTIIRCGTGDEVSSLASDSHLPPDCDKHEAQQLMKKF